MESIGLGKGNLIRNLPIETRNLHRENSLTQYKVTTGKELTGKEIVLMIEWMDGVYWQNKSVVAQHRYEVARLINSSIFRKNVN
jgi:hypothetical protein